MIKHLNRWVLLFLGILVMLFAGTLYAWSILKIPFAESFGWSPVQLSLNFTVLMVSFCIGSFSAGTLMRWFSPRLLLICAAGITLVGFGGASMMNGRSVHALYLSYGLCGGISVGIAYNLMVSIINEWFPDKKGTCSGALFMSYGGSTLLLGNLIEALMNSAIGWRGTYRLLGLVSALVMIAAALIVRHPEPEETIGFDPQAQNTFAESEQDFTPLQMLRDGRFQRFFVFLVCGCGVGIFVICMARDIAISCGAAAVQATMMVGFLSLCNGVGRLIIGMIYDRFGRRTAMWIDTVLTLFAPFSLLAALELHSLALCVVGLGVTGLAYAGLSPLTSTVIRQFYGMRNFSSNLSVCLTDVFFASLLSDLGSYLLTATGDYTAACVLMLALAVIAFAMNLTVRDRRKVD